MKFGEYMGSADWQHGEIGLEIETEASGPYTYVKNIEEYWNLQPDGSLRHNGLEYVFRRPYDYQSATYKAALDTFEAQTKLAPFIKSNYSSVHVHLNMMDKETVHMINFFVLYFLFEEFLTEYCGPLRNGNLFCLKTSVAELVYKTIRDMASAIAVGDGSSYIRNLNQGLLKYSGINAVPLRTLGSAEVRTHPGTVSRVEIERWIGILYKIYKRADTYENPVEIINRLHGYKSKVAFIELHFQEFTSFLNLNNVSEKMEDGIWYAASVAKAVDNWKDFGNKKSIKKAARPKIPLTQFAPGTIAFTNTAVPAQTITTGGVIQGNQATHVWFDDILNITPTEDL